jgi:hypothetical protein
VSREDILKKIRNLQAVADDERCPEGERANARALATKLKTKHTLTDDDLVEYDEVGGLFEGIFDTFRWSPTVRAEVDRIWGQVEAFADRLSRDEKGAARAEAMNAFYGHLRAKLGEDTAEAQEGTLKGRRDEALYDYFMAYAANERKSYGKHWNEKLGDGEHVFGSEKWIMAKTCERVASKCSADGAKLNKIQVGKIVARVRGWRRSRADQAKRATFINQPCVYCGSAEPNEWHQRTGAWAGDDGQYIAAHPRCWGQREKTA